MKAELVFNELSIREAATENEAKGWFTNMMEAVADLIDEDVCAAALHANLDLYEIDLLPDEYGFQEWVKDKNTDFELRQLAWHLITRTPVQKHLLAIKEYTEQFVRSEFKLEDETDCTALGVALLYDGIAVSLPSALHWQRDRVMFKQWFYDEALENPYQIHHEIRHVSSPEHVDNVIRHWRHGLSKKITDVEELIQQWETVFPYLDRCSEYANALPGCMCGETLQTTIERLWLLDKTCHQWNSQEKAEPAYPMDAHPESSETMRQYSESRQFTCPHDGKQYFTMHCRIQPSGYRLYWWVNRPMQRITTGHIGPHLPTKKYPKGQ